LIFLMLLAALHCNTSDSAVFVSRHFDTIHHHHQFHVSAFSWNSSTISSIL
jgi:hypothetical protein